MSTRLMVILFALLACAVGILLAAHGSPQGKMVTISAIVLLLLEASA